MPDVPLADAAATLGVRPEALRKRLQRGTVAGHKDEQGEWVVTLAEAPVPLNAPASLNGGTPAAPDRPAGEPGGQAGGHVQDTRAERVDVGGQPGGQAGGHVQDGSAPGPSEPMLLRELVAHQRELLDELREELAARRREVQQLHTLLAQAHQRMLPAPDGQALGIVDGVDAVDGVGSPPPAAAPAGAPAPSPGGRWPWWRRLWG